jgi:hypothetical protein
MDWTDVWYWVTVGSLLQLYNREKEEMGFHFFESLFFSFFFHFFETIGVHF